MSERLDCSATFTRPEAKHDSRLIDQVAVAESVSTLTSGKLQLNNPLDLFQPGVKPPRLFGAGVWNDNPTDFVLLQQPFDDPLVNSASATDKPGVTLMQERREVLLKQWPRNLSSDISRTENHYCVFNTH
jgi:hypothetical protein